MVPWSQSRKFPKIEPNEPQIVEDYDEEDHFDFLMDAMMRRPVIGAPTDVPDIKMTLEDFRLYAGLESSAVLTYWFKKGCPRAIDGMVYVPDVVDWAVSNGLPKGAPPLGVANQHEYVSPKEFADYIRIDYKKITGLYRLGLPKAYNGWIHFESGNSWVRGSKSKSASKVQADNPDEYETRTQFATRCGVHFATVVRWIKAGLPCLPNGNVHVEGGLEWVRNNRKQPGI